MSRRKCQFLDSFETTYLFAKRVNRDPHKFFCTVCNTTVSILNKGKFDIEQHANSKKHQQCSSVSTKQNLESYFRCKNLTSEEAKLTVIELTWSYHNVKHDHSFRDMDCTSNLLRKSCDRKITCGRTKSECLVTNVIYNWSEDRLRTDLQKASFVVVSCDASNHKNTKLLPVLARYCIVNSGIEIKTCILKIHSLPNETAETLSKVVVDDINLYNLQDKIIGLSADNAAVNFGGLSSKKTFGNVHAKLTSFLQREVFTIGCAAHIIHNALSAATSKIIPVDVENIMFKIYHHFNIFTVRTESLKEFCNFIGCQFEMVLSHSKTRWLSLSPCIDRILTMFEPLKSYFLSDDNSPLVLSNFFAAESSEFWLLFLQPQFHLFHETVKVIEASSISAVEVSVEYYSLLSKYKQRLEHLFIPFTAKKALKKLEDEGLIDTQNVMTVVVRFYTEIIAYLENWANRFCNEARKMKHLMLKEKFSYEEFQESYMFFINATKSLPMPAIDENAIFESYCCIKTCLDINLDKWEEDSVPLIVRWRTVLEGMKRANKEMKPLLLEKLVAFIFTLPGTNAECERIFSISSQYWTKEKSQLKVSTLESVMKVKVNVGLTCDEFYNTIKENTQLLQKAKSSEKYQT